MSRKKIHISEHQLNGSLASCINKTTSQGNYCQNYVWENVEDDEYVIGGEIDAPVGGRYYHVKPKNAKISENMVLEYLDKNYNGPLYRYFKWAESASDCELCRDIISEYPITITRYAAKVSHKYNGFFDYEDLSWEECEDDATMKSFIDMLSQNNLCEHFKSVVTDIMPYECLPTWYTCDFKRLVKNEWCIHFGNDADMIAREGFTGGTPYIERLAYTGAGQKKPTAGYNFAYSIVTSDRNMDFTERGGGHKYGNNAVIFRTSGVEVYHYGDNELQVIFYGPYAKDFIPITYLENDGVWAVCGLNGQILKSGSPSEIAYWAELNLPQYKKQIMLGKNGIQPKFYNYRTNKTEYLKTNNYGDYPFSEERIIRYLNILMENNLNEEVVADGSADHNPFAKRWKAESEALKSYLLNNGTIMTSRENGKEYLVLYDRFLSSIIGFNYCICLQYNSLTMEPGSTLYVRAYDKFTMKRFKPQFDTRGFDNVAGTNDDVMR